MKEDPELRAHREWIGFLQPTGIVVSPPALVAAGAYVDRNIAPVQNAIADLVIEDEDLGPVVDDLPRLFFDVLEWDEDDLVGYDGTEVPDELCEALTEYGDVLAPTYAVKDRDGWLMLIRREDDGTDLDALPADKAEGWHASPHSRFDRLLRSKSIPIGLLTNGTSLRLVYAPRGETTGHVTFPVGSMLAVAERPIVAAFHLLLDAERLFTLDDEERLPHLLAESRKYQNQVSEQLGEQVIRALWELLRGFEAADEKSGGTLLGYVKRNDPEHLYGGILATILRLVFVLYAEDNGLMPSDPVYQESYSASGLFTRLRDDAGRYPDHMDQRFGAWSQILTLFRLIFDGAHHGGLQLPARRGELFDPDTYHFLEGRAYRKRRVMGARVKPPRISDGTVFRVLQDLVMLKGERLSYRSLDVEQIGSVYEGMMGFTVEVAMGPSIAVGKDHVVVDLGKLLEMTPAARVKALADEAGVKLSGKGLNAFKEADDVESMVAALDRRISKRTPQIVPPEGLYLQPTEERRRSGSHYTPKSLTEPIVGTTLRPVFEQLGEHPSPGQILDLKVCDPAMGSGAFLVETCRQLGEALVEAWQFHKQEPDLPPDEDLVLHARRLVAQRCLYGVDRNLPAVNLAKLSLWLITLAKEHPFTFVDHALRLGDSLIGLSREQILSFDWETGDQIPIIRDVVGKALQRAEIKRRQIQDLGDLPNNKEKRRLLKEADEALADIRLIGNLLVAAFFGGKKGKGRKDLRTEYESKISIWQAGNQSRQSLASIVEETLTRERSIAPFHWEIEFPEVFGPINSGFDCVIGNPPFLGGTRISTVLGMSYFEFIKEQYPPAGHLCDMVAYFFRRAYSAIRRSGTLGLVATNTITQGDTRAGGLAAICSEGGAIYEARRRLPWPGRAAVVVSTIHIFKGAYEGYGTLDGKRVEKLTAYLFTSGVNSDPARLQRQGDLFSAGSKIYGQGFVFDDSDPKANSTEDFNRILRLGENYSRRVYPYIGGEEVNNDPRQSHRRHVIYLSDVQREEDLLEWPELERIVREKVKPERDRLGNNPNNIPLKRRWWAYQAHRPKLYASLQSMDRVIVNCQVSNNLAFAYQTCDRIFAHTLNIFLLEDWGSFCLLQSRTHESWARFFGSSMKDDLRYTPSDCFETFPFPVRWRADATLLEFGTKYYDFRAHLMIKNGEGLTKTYNRFHNPEETDSGILRLRDLHDEMDRAVLDAYGWTDIRPRCEFLLDYEVEDDEPGKRRKKKPWRYRWPDDVRDEVLGRLLELNAERAAEEKRLGMEAELKAKKKPKKARASAGAEASDGQVTLPGLGTDE